MIEAIRRAVSDVGSRRDLEHVRAEWNDLAARTDGSSYFQTGDWVLAWWDTVAGRPVTSVACWRDASGRLVAVAAVSRGSERVHRRVPLSLPVSRVAGSGPGDADHCGPLAPPALHDDVARWLRAAGGRRTLLAPVSAATGALLARVPGARTTELVVCPQLRFDELAERRAARSSNFRNQLGRYGRRLERAGVALEWVAPGRVDAAVVDTAYDLHRRLRAERALPTSLSDAHHRLLQECRALSAADRGLAGVVARHGDRVVGALLGFWWNGCFHAYQSGWDPAYATQSIGSVLVSNAIEGARAAGAHTFDFLRGGEAYKYRFGAVDAHDALYVVPRGLAGRVLVWRAERRRGHTGAAATDDANRSPSLAAST